MDSRDEALSMLDWWRTAGVDVLVQDAPRDWLRRSVPAPAPVQDGVAPVAARSDRMPATIAEVHARLATDPEFGEGRRVAPFGAPHGGLTIFVDMPEQADLDAGALLSGQLGQLFDRMLAAIGRDRASAYVAPLSPTRPIGGRVAPSAIGQLAPFALHHAVLAAPRALLLAGEAASRAFLGIGHVEARGRVHEINHGQAKLTAIATIHPRDLLRNAGRKADAWRDLRLLIEVLNT